ncbi:MAG: FAD-dependent oxidoreductase [bacterium]|nr:FAD-dependent oxidoreductase [bacterium]
MRRRTFLHQTSVFAVASLFPGLNPVSAFASGELSADAVIIGGGLGGCACALALARNGKRVVMTEETLWIGGQPTQQAVPFDEHPWIEQFGATRTYREYRSRIREYYRRNYPLTAEARARDFLNPGGGWVSRIACEPRVALNALIEMLSPHVSGGRIRILLQTVPVSAEVSGDRVEAVRVRNILSGDECVLTAPYIVDATELGDLLPMTGAEYVTGFESQAQTGEAMAPAEAQPQNMQPITWCFAMDYLEGEDHTIDKPEDYTFWRDYVPELTPPWPGKLFSWTYSAPNGPDNARTLPFDPPRECDEGVMGWFTYRRILDDANFKPGAVPADATIVNWPQNDYLLGSIVDVSPDEKAKHLRGARQVSLSLLYWMQTEAPRPDGGTGWPGLRPRPDMTGTDDGLAQYPYIREARRIQAEFTVTAEHVGAEARAKAMGVSVNQATAADFDDSIGVGAYRMDLHPSIGGDNYIDLPTCPFQIPLGAMIPKRLENLVPACKNIGTTHLSNGTYRLHPVEWNIGESAGELIAFCLNGGESPRGVRNMPEKLRSFQRKLTSAGVELKWPSVRPL